MLSQLMVCVMNREGWLAASGPPARSCMTSVFEQYVYLSTPSTSVAAGWLDIPIFGIKSKKLISLQMLVLARVTRIKHKIYKTIIDSKRATPISYQSYITTICVFLTVQKLLRNLVVAGISLLKPKYRRL